MSDERRRVQIIRSRAEDFASGCTAVDNFRVPRPYLAR